METIIMDAVGLEAIKDGPKRVLINMEGEAISSRRAAELGIRPETVFIRDDGWSLGCLKNHEPVAAHMWHKNWQSVVTDYGTDKQQLVPFSEFTPTRGDGKPVD